MESIEQHCESLRRLQPLGAGPKVDEQLCDMLESVQLLRDLNRPDIEALAECAGAYRAPADTVIFHEGQRDPFLCLVVEGRLQVFKEQDTATRRKLATIRAGKVIGEMSLIDGLPHSATVVATEASTLLILTSRGLERLEQTRPRLALRLTWKLARELSQRLRQTSGLLVDHL